MRPCPRHRATALCAVALLLIPALAGCGDDGDEAADTGAAVESDERRTTTTSDDDTATTADDGATTTTAAGGDEIGADESVADDTWSYTPIQHRDQQGLRIAVTCSPNGQIHSVWGSDPYTDDSSVCTAAVHAGLITVEDGGRVVIEVRGAEDSFTGTEANGVTSTDYGPWEGSFIFLGRD